MAFEYLAQIRAEGVVITAVLLELKAEAGEPRGRRKKKEEEDEGSKVSWDPYRGSPSAPTSVHEGIERRSQYSDCRTFKSF